MMRQQLTRLQFIAFVGHIWSDGYWADKMQENLWGGIAALEANRTFDDGCDYCESRLLVAANGKDFSMVWDYETTSGTKLHVWQSRLTDYEGSDEPEFVVSIPEQGREHYDALVQIVLDIP